MSNFLEAWKQYELHSRIAYALDVKSKQERAANSLFCQAWLAGQADAHRELASRWRKIALTSQNRQRPLASGSKTTQGLGLLGSSGLPGFYLSSGVSCNLQMSD